MVTRAAAWALALLLAWACPVFASADPTPEPPPRLILVLDASGSMAEQHSSGSTRIDMARSALYSIVPNLPPDAEVGLRLLGSDIDGDPMPAAACQDTKLVVAPSRDNRAELLSAIEQISPLGWTPIPEALRQAAADLGETGKRSILLVSDGQSTCDPDPCQVAAEVRASKVDVTIDVVGLDVDQATRNQLECIASAGGGSYTDARSAQELAEAMDHAASRALRPFTYLGQQVDGTGDPAAAPGLVPGYWLDELPAAQWEEQQLYYRVARTQPGSVLLASVFTLPATSEWDGVDIELRAPDGTRCFVDEDTKTGGVIPLIAGTSTRAVAVLEDPACQRDDYLVRVSRDRWRNSATPLPFQLRIQELPGWIDPTGSAPAPGFDGDHVAPGTAQPIDPGTSLADAPLVAPGSYTADLVQGEVLSFRLPTAWGQASRATVRIAPDDAAKVSAYAGSIFLAPVLPSGDGVEGVRDTQVIVDEGIQLSASTPALWAGDREGLAPSGDVTYVLIWNPGLSAPSDVTLPFTLSFELAGQAVAAPEPSTPRTVPSNQPSGAPGSATQPGGVSPGEQASAQPIEAGPHQDETLPDRVIAAGLGVVIAAVGAALVWAIRR